MKIGEISEASKGSGWTNDTNSYFMVMGIQGIPYPAPRGSGIFTAQAGMLYDTGGNQVDAFYTLITEISEYTQSVSQGTNGSMPVWNGSSVVDEAYSSPSFSQTQYLASNFSIVKPFMIIPPGYTFKLFALAWGFWLSLDELMEMI
ncbi:MAG: hypothetical protein QW292_14305 [Candidatus Parvarchaeota archaeon]